MKRLIFKQTYFLDKGFRRSSLLLAFFLVSCVSFDLDGLFASDKRKSGICRRTFEVMVVLGVTVTATPTSNMVANEVRAVLRDQSHLGMGIFFDREGVEGKMSEEQRALLENPKENAIEIARVLYGLLNSTYDSSLVRKKDWYPAPHEASDYLGDDALHEGVCRHKACVFKGILDEYGVKAELYSARGEGDQGHVFVYLPEVDAVFDPVAQVEAYRMEDLRQHPFFTNKQLFKTSSHWFWGPFHTLEDAISR